MPRCCKWLSVVVVNFISNRTKKTQKNKKKLNKSMNRKIQDLDQHVSISYSYLSLALSHFKQQHHAHIVQHSKPFKIPVTLYWTRHLFSEFDVFFDVRLSDGWANNRDDGDFETPSRSLWRDCNEEPRKDAPWLARKGGVWCVFCGFIVRS